MSVEIEAAYGVVTPMFCGGADPGSAELRIPSFKGVLRFWWRALAWSRCGGDLKTIQKEEDQLFGSAVGGRSRVVITHVEPVKWETGFGSELRVGPGARYLGYGVLEHGAAQRAFLEPGFGFTVHMRTRDLDRAWMSSLENALMALGLFGGMGARSRKGYGSVSIRSLLVGGRARWREPTSTAELAVKLRLFHCDSGRPNLPEYPEYTALSEASRHLLVPSDHGDSLELLDRMGREFKEAVGSTPRRDRDVFGLPRKAGDACRRASPLFIHVHQCDDRPIGVVSFLPARFLSENGSPSSGRESRLAREGRRYKPIHDFLDHLGNQPNVIEVKP